MQWCGILLMSALLTVVPVYAGAQAAGQPNAPRDTGSPAPASKSYSRAEKQAYLQKTDSDLSEIQQRIKELEVKGRTVPQQKKRMAVRSLMGLQKMADSARRQLAALKTIPDKDWSTAKAGMDKDMADLSMAYQEVEAHLN
jgi:uncharacterized protein YpuA (DUF1002 family)